MTNIVPVPNSAPLPLTYEAAQRALADCSRIDECKTWADKAQALASYARQAKDDTLRRMAMRIQNRAIRRAGELLEQIEPGKGGRPAETRDGTDPSFGDCQQPHPVALITRTKAAADAGMSERQRKTALRIASIPESVFEAAVESTTPPTVTQLAAMGTTKHPDSRTVQPAAPADHHAAASIALNPTLAYCNRWAMADAAAATVSQIGWPITTDDIFADLVQADFDDTELMTPEGITALARVIQARMMRERGEIPPGWTAITECRRCGPVPIWEGSLPRVMGCPWCFNRLEGRPIPRALSEQVVS